MQKVLQRSAAARQSAARGPARKSSQGPSGEWRERAQSRIRFQAAERGRLAEARQARREDWELRELAPRRDVGDRKERYGTLDVEDIQTVEKERRDRKRWWGIAAGDRVCVVEGTRDKGKIGTVKDVDSKTEMVRVDGLNMADLFVPDYMREEDGGSRTIIPYSRGIPLSSVRLVVPLPDPKTGILRDTIVDRVDRIKIRTKRSPTSTVIKQPKHGRRIPGLRVIIPWPEMTSPAPPEDNDDDTLRISVEEVTFQPVLLGMPMPPTVIDELRNKYSRFRVRHDDAYIARKEAEDIAAEEKTSKTMMTPLEEAREKRRMEKAEREVSGSSDLSEEVMARIGEMVVRGQLAKGGKTMRRPVQVDVPEMQQELERQESSR
ncbi:hypothetical protein LTR66_001902 [Elasticomyces elasticus]|nr:hypothetical protein LTR66_001902 [Elasticomyces elasticus]